MSILGRGDLSPPRRHGGYGRRRRRWPRVLLVLVILAALAAGGWWVWQHFHDDSDKVNAAATPCQTPSHPPAPVALTRAKFAVHNGTKRVGLAQRVAHQLRQRGATVLAVGNTKTRARATVVSYPGDPSGHAVALAVREQLAAPTRLTVAAKPPVVLVIGSDFRGLARPAAAVAARQRDVAAAAPSPGACAGS